MKKIQKATLVIFFSCMVITAVLMLVSVWTFMAQADKGPNPVMQYIFTFFIVGLASFLTWFTTMILEIRDKVERR
jgi:hypothetical protein